MADVALAAKGASSDPITYVIPGAQEILIKAARASFDGSSAAGPYVPTLRILDPNGNELAACPISSTLTAGASADVSWFPRGGIGAAVTPTTAFHGCRTLGLGPDCSGTLSVTSGTKTVTGVGTHFLTDLRPGDIYGVRFYLANNETLIVDTIQSDTQFTSLTNALATHTGEVAAIDQQMASGVYTAVLYQGTDLFDTNDYHFTSNATLSGTLAKTNGNTAITGVGTAFTTEVSVNQAIKIPGPTTDAVLVRSIIDDTHLTVWPNNPPTSTASGQTASFDPSVVGIPAGLGGYYRVTAQQDWRSTSDGSERAGTIVINNRGPSHLDRTYSWTDTHSEQVHTNETAYVTTNTWFLAEGDYVRDFAFQAFGGVVGLTMPYGLTVERVGT